MDVRFQAEGIKFNFRAAGILIEKNHVLLHKQKEDHYWALPGGGIELGERSRDAVVREFEEELGCTCHVKGLPWIAENFFTYKDIQMHEVGFYYVLEAEESYFREDSFHGLEGERLVYRWVPLSAIYEYPVLPGFLPAGLQHIPRVTEHLIMEEK
ncbi:NUDIX domain-containing protein [Halobacillus rhizosphaerae]|uniref:NUDIX hydrolase n=1 Tax=Halobacillus rhizosphaerae TaxID=3064889 RepID=UPI00398B6734